MLKTVLIGTDVAYTNKTSPSALLSGEIGVYSVATDGTYTLITGAISAAQGLLPIVIAQGVPAGKNIKLFTIQPKEKKAYLNTAYAAPVPNVWNIGFDGTSYDLQSGVIGSYGFKIQNLTSGNQPFPTVSSTPSFNTIANATSIKVAEAIVKEVNTQMLYNNRNIEPAQLFAFAEVLANVATGAPASAPIATVTTGSNTVVLSGASGSIVPGVWMRFGAANGSTYAVYKVAAVSGTTVTLDSPYVNSQVTLGTSIAGLTTGFVAAATIATVEAGIRVTEYGNTYNGMGVLEPQPNKILNVSCNLNLSDTPMQNNQIVTKAYTAAAGTITTGVYTEGNGTYPQIFKKELIAAGYWGFTNRIFLPDNFPLYSVSTTNYVTMGIQYGTTVNDYTAQGFKAGETQEAIIAVPTGSSQATTLNTILASTNW